MGDDVPAPDAVDRAARPFDARDARRSWSTQRDDVVRRLRLRRARSSTTERFFWGFCDDYLELVKQRAYGSRGDDPTRSAQAALAVALDTLLRLFAPHLPFVTEEVWSWWREGSVHRAAWPTVDELARSRPTTSRLLRRRPRCSARSARRRATAKRSMRTEVTRADGARAGELLRALEPALDDLREAGRVVGALELVEPGDELAVDVDLAAPEPA